MALVPAACGRVHFRVAMNEVQRRYTELFDRVEGNFAVASRAKALEVKQALLDPAITGSRRYLDDDDFREMHGAALRALDDFQKEPGKQDRDRLLVLRSDVTARCQACHDRFRDR